MNGFTVSPYDEEGRPVRSSLDDYINAYRGGIEKPRPTASWYDTLDALAHVLTGGMMVRGGMGSPIPRFGRKPETSAYADYAGTAMPKGPIRHNPTRQVEGLREGARQKNYKPDLNFGKDPIEVSEADRAIAAQIKQRVMQRRSQ